ncbi:MAG: PAS domain S-box protein, partial [Alphaproteobacteria bacterium]|nr:PAS domain S-box protein [Alphaproteobacteria bacterium]
MSDGGRGRDFVEQAEREQSRAARPAAPAIAASERQFRNLIEGSNQGILVQRDDKVLFANQALADILGYDSVADLMQIESVDAHIHPDDLDLSRRYRSDRLGGATPPADYELRAMRKDGSTTWLSCRAMIVDWDGAPASQSVLFDIDERKRIERALDASKALMQRIYANISESVLVVDVETRTIVGGNPAMERLFGHCEEELIGLDLAVLHADMTQFERLWDVMFPVL